MLFRATKNRRISLSDGRTPCTTIQCTGQNSWVLLPYLFHSAGSNSRTANTIFHLPSVQDMDIPGFTVTSYSARMTKSLFFPPFSLASLRRSDYRMTMPLTVAPSPLANLNSYWEDLSEQRDSHYLRVTIL